MPRNYKKLERFRNIARCVLRERSLYPIFSITSLLQAERTADPECADAPACAFDRLTTKNAIEVGKKTPAFAHAHSHTARSWTMYAKKCRSGARRGAAAIIAVILFGGALAAPGLVVADPAATPFGDSLCAQSTPLPGIAVSQEDSTLERLYQRRADRPLWSNRALISSQAKELLSLLSSSGDLGLVPSDYGTDLLVSAQRCLLASRATSILGWAQFDHWLSAAATRLVTHLHYGRIDPRVAGFELPGPRSDLDVASAVESLSTAADVAATVTSIEPHFYHYALLKSVLARYRKLAAISTLFQLPAIGKGKLRINDNYQGASELRNLLTALGDLPAEEAAVAASDLSLDPALIEALKRFQQRHGLNPDGVLSGRTFDALITPPDVRVRQIELTLERWRWLPAFETPPIIVNIPQFTLFAFRTTTDRLADIDQMGVIVGQAYPRTRTPVFVGEMKYVNFRPYWDVPRSITVREMLPAISANPRYLQRNSLEIVSGDDDNHAIVHAPTVQALAELSAGHFRLRQTPGEDNALGLVKFVFPNVHDVYLHSTPARQLFLQSRRAFSHGCIRVSDPVSLAVYVLRNNSGAWDTGKVNAAMHQPLSSRVTLSQPIKVMILYGTALATEDGSVHFFDDIYGHDSKLEALLSNREAARRQ